jgi:hypothetical protein
MFIFRVFIGNAPPARVTGRGHLSALEKSIRMYAEKPSDIVIKPKIGTGLNSIEEAYDFYNLYSWEVGIGIRYGKSILNIERKKGMQELVCGCAVRSCFIILRCMKTLRMCVHVTNWLCFARRRKTHAT